MRRSVITATGLGLALALASTAEVLAHGGGAGTGIAVEPANVTAGDTVVLAGKGLEPTSDRVLVLVGGNLSIAFGTVKTDANGAFSRELTIPAYLPSGSYELQAIGDETLTTPLDVTAVAGGAAASAPANDTKSTVIARDRSPAELALIAAFVIIAAGIGLLLVWRAERFRGPAAT